MRASESKRNRQRGAALLETSLAILLFLGLVFAVIEFGRAVYSYNVLAAATREATRYAIVHGSGSSSPATEADLKARVTKWAIGLNPSALTVSASWSPSNAPGSSVAVRSDYALSPITRLVLRNSITLTTRSEMVISQ
jgi:Flp pilus assembly protein TadG